MEFWNQTDHLLVEHIDDILVWESGTVIICYSLTPDLLKLSLFLADWPHNLQPSMQNENASLPI